MYRSIDILLWWGECWICLCHKLQLLFFFFFVFPEFDFGFDISCLIYFSLLNLIRTFRFVNYVKLISGTYFPLLHFSYDKSLRENKVVVASRMAAIIDLRR